MTISSNASAHALLRILGRDEVNAAMVGRGLRDTLLPTSRTRTGVIDTDGTQIAATSARDVLCYLVLLGRDQLAGPAANARMRDVLARQQINDRLPALLPPDARVAHKTGELTSVRNDVGIVSTPRGTWAIAVLSRDVEGTDASGVIARLSRHVYDYFAPAS